MRKIFSAFFCFFIACLMPMRISSFENYGEKSNNKSTVWELHQLRLMKAQMNMEEVNRRAVTWKAAILDHFSFLDKSEKHFYARGDTNGKLPEEPHQSGGTEGYEIRPKPLVEDEPELDYFGQVDPSTYKPITERSGDGSSVTCIDYRFDIRKKWPECAGIISEIRDQSECASCYAVAGAAAFTDRYCVAIAKRGRPKPAADQDRFYFSAADIMQCSDAADGQDACKGGWSNKVWRFLNEHGVVSGNGYSQGGCKPYPFPPKNGKNIGNAFQCATECEQRCPNAHYGHEYGADKQKTSNWHTLGNLSADGTGQSWEQVVKEELFANGTVPADMVVYDDFLTLYPGGIYHQASNDSHGGHVVRLIGYGRVNCSDGQSTNYWLGANSWNTNWGEKGFFRIRRGTNEVGIESRDISFGAIELSAGG